MIVKFVWLAAGGRGGGYLHGGTYTCTVYTLLTVCPFAVDHYVHEETQSSLKKKHVSLVTFCSKDVLCPCKLSFAKALNGNNRKKGRKIKSQIVLFGVKDSQGLSFV